MISKIGHFIYYLTDCQMLKSIIFLCFEQTILLLYKTNFDTYLCSMKFNKLVVFYDGDCGFCNKSIQFILNNSNPNELYFSSLQSKFTLDFFAEHSFSAPNLSTFYFYQEGQLYSKSTAALKIVRMLKWYLQFLLVGYLIPKFLRDKMYDAIAKRRNKLAPDFCAMPSQDERKRFLN